MKQTISLNTIVLALVGLSWTVAAEQRGTAHVPLPADLAGTLDGIDYRISVPANWNGKLLVFAHETQLAQPIAELAPIAWPSATPSVEQRLLGQGFALAGSGYPNSDKGGIQATVALTEFFEKQVGHAERVIVWGNSLGGLLTLKMIEDYPGLFDGAIANCAVSAGDPMNMDWALAFGLAYSAAYGWQDSLWGPIESLVPGLNFFTDVAPYVSWPGDPAEYGKWEFIRRVVQLPPEAFWTGDPLSGNPFFGMNMWKATDVRSRLQVEAGGRVAQNVGQVYTLTLADKTELATLGVNADALLAYMNARTNITAQDSAREYLEEWGEPTGKLHRPVITMHAIYDGLVPVANEGVYAARVAESKDSERLVQAYVNTIGHCSFSAEQYLSTVSAMNSWLDTRQRPDTAAFPASLGFNLGFVPPPWPFIYRDQDGHDHHHDHH